MSVSAADSCANAGGKMNEIKYEITRRIAVIKEESGGWATELNEVSWNGAEPKYDIRRWNSDHTKMGKGITLTKAEAVNLFLALQDELK